MVLVSAIITTHKRSPNIVQRAINSVVDQTYSNIEIIVVDDSPSNYELRNETRRMVENYEGVNIKYIAHDDCKGACAARNTGLSMANGEFVGFLDDDDEWCPEKVEKLLPGFDHDDVALVYCHSVAFNEKTNSSQLRDIPVHVGYVFDKLIYSNFVGSTSFPLIRTSALRMIGGFDVLQESAQDYDVWLRLSEQYKVNFVDDALNIYHTYEGERISKSSAKRISGLERLNEKNKEYLSKHRIAYWYRYTALVPEYANNKQYGKALVVWFKAICKRPFYLRENLAYLYRLLRIMLVNAKK